MFTRRLGFAALGLSCVIGISGCSSTAPATRTSDDDSGTGGQSAGYGRSSGSGGNTSSGGHGIADTGAPPTGADASAPEPDAATSDAATGGAASDSGSSRDTDAAGNTDAGDTATCSSDCPFHACDGAACAVTKFSTAGALIWDLAVTPDALYWDEITGIHACAMPGPCTGFGDHIADPGLANFALATAHTADTDYFFTTDEWRNTGGLWRTKRSDSTSERWATSPDGPSAIALSGNVIVWGDRKATFRSRVDAAGATQVMDVAPGFILGIMPSPAQHNVAVDSTTLFAASTTDVFRCPVADTCVGKLVPAATAPMRNVVALTVQRETLYALGGQPFTIGGSEIVWSVPTAGGSATPLSVMSPTATHGGTPFGLLADDRNVYWSSLDDDIYTCQSGAECRPTMLVAGARSFAMTQDASFIYWTDREAMYRVAKPAR